MFSSVQWQKLCNMIISNNSKVKLHLELVRVISEIYMGLILLITGSVEMDFLCSLLQIEVISKLDQQVTTLKYT